MILRRILTLFAATGLLLAPVVPAAEASPATSLTECSATFFHGDKRLGPEHLPLLGEVGLELVGYHRTGRLGEDTFLQQYYDGTASSWRYPPQNGYQLRPDGTPIEFHAKLVPGQKIDRYGSEYGSFLSPKGLPYATRAIPPQSLDGTPAAGCNYHVYRVAKAFTVDAGPIAAWFAQPGGGLQYQLDGSLVPGAPASLTVMWLVDGGYLERVR